MIGDLRSAAETRSIADQVNAIGRMDAVIHNAGVYTERSRGSTPEGHAGILAVNTLAPYMLTALIERPARLVYLSSGLHRGGEGSLGDLDWTKRPWDPARAYAESKLHVVALALALARRWPQVLSNAVDPGWVRTKMGGPRGPGGPRHRTADPDLAGRKRRARPPWSAVATGITSGSSSQPAKATDPEFQDQLIAKLSELTGVALPEDTPATGR